MQFTINLNSFLNFCYKLCIHIYISNRKLTKELKNIINLNKIYSKSIKTIQI